MNNTFYQKILKQSEEIQPNPEGLSTHQPHGQADQILIKQNNTIILLLIELNNKLEILVKQKAPEISESNIDTLVNQLKRIEITPQKDRPLRTKQSWKFFQVGEETTTKEVAIPPP